MLMAFTRSVPASDWAPYRPEAAGPVEYRAFASCEKPDEPVFRSRQGEAGLIPPKSTGSSRRRRSGQGSRLRYWHTGSGMPMPRIASIGAFRSTLFRRPGARQRGGDGPVSPCSAVRQFGAVSGRLKGSCVLGPVQGFLDFLKPPREIINPGVELPDDFDNRLCFFCIGTAVEGSFYLLKRLVHFVETFACRHLLSSFARR